ncbi:MAG: HEAT repeat domain-containing protein [Terriglobia bacterium]
MTRYFMLSSCCFLLLPVLSHAQAPKPSTPVAPASQQQQDDAVIPGDWAPELLDAILSSPNPAARQALLDAAFAAGPGIVPQLEAALKDDRTAEFAAKSLALIGGNTALDILSKLVQDPRDLDLRRFFYGALGELRTPEATQVLLNTLAASDAEPDRTVTEAAIVALTVRPDLNLLSPLRQIESKIKDVVIHDDMENAIEVIESRAKYMASPEGQSAGSSIERAVRTYFIPALGPSVTPATPVKLRAKNVRPVKSAPARPPSAQSDVSVEIHNLTFSPDKNRALARVVFQDPSALANYDMVLQKENGDWIIASVWLGEETEKAPPVPGPKSSPEN